MRKIISFVCITSCVALLVSPLAQAADMRSLETRINNVADDGFVLVLLQRRDLIFAPGGLAALERMIVAAKLRAASRATAAGPEIFRPDSIQDTSDPMESRPEAQSGRDGSKSARDGDPGQGHTPGSYRETAPVNNQNDRTK